MITLLRRWRLARLLIQLVEVEGELKELRRFQEHTGLQYQAAIEEVEKEREELVEKIAVIKKKLGYGK